ncbi:hypothetical protein HRbin12_01364 [bacterium HR12]|nr:hypothetical protein HRbin12_01364 [bacterium HR12]
MELAPQLGEPRSHREGDLPQAPRPATLLDREVRHVDPTRFILAPGDTPDQRAGLAAAPGQPRDLGLQALPPKSRAQNVGDREGSGRGPQLHERVAEPRACLENRLVLRVPRVGPTSEPVRGAEPLDLMTPGTRSFTHIVEEDRPERAQRLAALIHGFDDRPDVLAPSGSARRPDVAADQPPPADRVVDRVQDVLHPGCGDLFRQCGGGRLLEVVRFVEDELGGHLGPTVRVRDEDGVVQNRHVRDLPLLEGAPVEASMLERGPGDARSFLHAQGPPQPSHGNPLFDGPRRQVVPLPGRGLPGPAGDDGER